jgi:hypothetical protein
VASLEDLSVSGHFANLTDDMDSNEAKWLLFLNDPGMAEQIMPEPYKTDSDVTAKNETARLLKKLMIVKVLRPDRLLAVTRAFVSSVFSGTDIANIN